MTYHLTGAVPSGWEVWPWPPSGRVGNAGIEPSPWVCYMQHKDMSDRNYRPTEDRPTNRNEVRLKPHGVSRATATHFQAMPIFCGQGREGEQEQEQLQPTTKSYPIFGVGKGEGESKSKGTQS